MTGPEAAGIVRVGIAQWTPGPDPGNNLDTAESALRELMERDEENGVPAADVAAVVRRVLESRRPPWEGVRRQGRRASRLAGQAAAAVPRFRSRHQEQPGSLMNLVTGLPRE
jgi:hypothetical protein